MKFFCRLILYALIVVILVLVFPLIYGCSGDSGSFNSFNELLKLLPSDVDLSQMPIILLDYASFFKDNDISLTGEDDRYKTFQELIELLREKEKMDVPMSSDSFITGWGPYAIEELICDKNVGYNYTSIDAEIQAGLTPNNIVAAVGQFDPQATRNALKYQDEWPAWAVDAYNTEEYRGVTIHSWGDGFKMNLLTTLLPPHIDEFGRAKPLAVTDDYLFYAASVEAIKLMIDASQGKVESLADLPEYAQIVGQMSGLNIYSLLMGSESLVNDDPEYEGTYPGPRLKKFVTFGSASGQDENGIYLLLVIYHENSSDARSNVSLLEQRINDTDLMLLEVPWSEIITDTEIKVDGKILVAKLYTMHPGIWDGWVYAREPLLLHEE